ncbi:caspase-8 [Protopterus annectens]|uniref:caspase-8 n=1 Tax=Protopterus annectens TaxID=7888 RepID=UPI001CFC0055|nr:caspase-8 [Protopterus annectens]
MTFHTSLYKLDEHLDTDNVAALKFLCLDHIPHKKQEDITEGMDLFQNLEDRGLLEENNFSILTELLFRIKRMDLLKKLGTTKEEMENELQIPGRAQISLYRQLLYDISEDVTKDDIKSVKFFLSDKLPKCKLEKDTTMLHVLTEMEKIGLLGEDRLEDLKMICRKIRPALVVKIEIVEQKIREIPQRQRCTEPVPVSAHSFESCLEESVRSLQISTESLLQSVSTLSLSSLSEESTRSFAISDDEQCNSQSAAISTDIISRNEQNETTNESINQDETVYEMKHKPHGYCLIINNHNFEEARKKPEFSFIKDRRGSDVDADSLKDVFHFLNFEVEQHNNLSAKRMMELFRSYQIKDHKNKDCFVCCILSHGKKGTVWGIDGESIDIKTITSHFTALQCHSLCGKPKVFFIQACQGEQFQRAIPIEADSNDYDSLPSYQGSNFIESIPEYADFLLGMATIEHFVSYRSPSSGSWYIQSLCSNLKDGSTRGDDLLTILTKVNNEVSKKLDTERNAKQMPQPKFTLRKKIIFPVC